MIKLRFVTGNDIVSGLIRLQAGEATPFTPSHVEAVSQDGKFYVGAHLQGGVQSRPVGYDVPFKNELIVSIPVTLDVEAAFYCFVNSKINTPYDWKAIVEFAAPSLELHDQGHVICSAFMAAGMVKSGAFQPLAVPYHHISPRDLLLAVSSHVKVSQ